MKIILMILLLSASNLFGGATHQIIGKVTVAYHDPIPNCEVICIDSMGNRHTTTTNAKGEYVFLAIPLGHAQLRAVSPKGLALAACPINVESPYSDCTRDVFVPLMLYGEANSLVIIGPEFATSLPPGTFHFHPNAKPEWQYL